MQPIEMIPLADYASPAMPTEHAFRSAWRRLQQRVRGGTDGPMLPSAGLERSPRQVLDDVADPPAAAPLLQSLEQHLGGWARSRDAAPRLQLVVVPPCDRTGALETWARATGHALLTAPQRSDLRSTEPHIAARSFAGEDLIVIPSLEHWFIRQRNGLHAVRSLLAQLAAGSQQCLIGCNSWAWAYLVKAADAELMLPRPMTFEALDAARLRRWFTDLATDDGKDATFRLALSGEDVLACDDAGEPHSNWLRQLAARSGGIPWVAWHLWRASLQLRSDGTALSERAAQTVADDRRTVWIVDVEDPRLPASHEDRALLTLQALLIHGALTAAEVEAVLPATGEADVLPALAGSGHLRCDRGAYSVRPGAYPAVREALQAADFPIGAI